MSYIGDILNHLNNNNVFHFSLIRLCGARENGPLCWVPGAMQLQINSTVFGIGDMISNTEMKKSGSVKAGAFVFTNITKTPIAICFTQDLSN